MITLIIGKKGSGKTKRLLDMCATATKESNGNVVFLEKDNTLTYNLDHKTRLVALDEYGINSFASLYGFIAGMCAGNYDITDVFVDSTLKVAGNDMEELAAFVENLSRLNVKMVLSISADKDEIPARIAEYATEI